MERKIKILHFEKNINSDVIESTMRKEFLNCEVKKTFSTREFMNALKTEVYDVILTDNDVSNSDVLSEFKYAKEISPHSAFILLSAIQDEILLGGNDKMHEMQRIPRAELDLIVPAINEAMDKTFSLQDVSCHWG